MPKKFWKFQNSVSSDGKELILEGPIASETWWGDEVTPQEFRDELKNHSGDKLTVVLNSGGGDVFAGLSIYNALRELDAEVTIRVDGLAASIASIIAMAGDKVIMSPGSLMMIHRPSVFAAGNVDDLEKAKELLLKIEESITPIYVEKTGLSTEEVATMLEAETWMSAEEAVQLGFADEMATSEKASLKQTIQNALNGNFAFNMQATHEAIVNLAEKMEASKTKEVTNVDDLPKAEAPVSTAPADEKEAKPKAETIETKDPAAEEVVEPTAAATNQPTDKETPEMTAEEKKAAEEAATQASSQILEPAAQAPVAPDAKMTVKDYLAKPASMDAFANILQEQAGKTSEDVKNAWKEHLEVTLGVTNPEIFLPQTLITEIEDAFKAGGEIWNRVAKTGADVFRAAWDTQTDVSSEDGRGRGYNRADAEEKAEQVLTIDERVLRPQFIYKYITLNKEDVKNQRSTGALVRYVLSELPRRIVREVERAIVIGDGRAPGDDYKITSFVAIKADATAGNVFASTYTPAVGESRYSSLLQAKDEVLADGPLVLVCKKGYLTELLLEQSVSGGFLFAPGTNLGALLGFDAVVEPDWMSADTDNDAYIVSFSDYKTVGDNSIESFTNFTLKTNKQEYLQEIWAGGGLTGRKAAVAIAVTPAS